MNTVQLTGRLTTDPQLTHLPDGTAACKVRLAVREMGTAREVGYVDVTEYGAGGEAAERELKRGWLVAVRGALKYRQWLGEGGARRHDYEVRGHIEFLCPPRTDEANLTQVDQGEGSAVAA